MPEQLQQQVETCYRLAEQHFARPFARPVVSLALRGQKAGVAHLQENKLRFNAALYRANREHFLAQTVPHEVAHLIAHQLFGSRIRPHGPEWQAIMRNVFQRPAERCHSYSVAQRPRTHYLYRCACSEPLPFTAQRHARVAKGSRYLCRRCRQPLAFSGQTCQR
ncbi:SprT protein [Atopomonas hussainii]|uniref:SprT protein n=1 Tax=Atopomonas hussainii TaxID=1429083 RepID=A0A1H7H7R9_9GAMM|nr:SprT family zinc-dependent metalloprotease [Atopomonas hussainii]SEK45040.1 SprT protein [Atopomonas hussainii]